MSKLRVFLADDHPVVREGLKALVNGQPDMEVIGEAADGESAWRLARDSRPDVLVIDISMPGLNGAEVTRQLLEERPEIRVLTLSVHEDIGYLQRMLAMGAAGYVLKRSAADALLRGIRSVAKGETFLDPALAGRVASRLAAQSDQRVALAQSDLSARETDVLTLLAKGYSNKEIAAQLSLSVKTIETYKVRAMNKLGISGRVALVRYAIQQGWLS